MRSHAVTVDIVPASPDDPALVRHAGVPLVRLVKTQARDVAAVGRHVVQRIGRAYPSAPQITASPFADESDAAVRQPDGIEIVPGSVGQLFQPRAVDVHLENMVAPAGFPMPAGRVGMIVVVPFASAFHVREQNALAVVGQVGGEEGTAFEPLALQPASFDDRIGQYIGDSGVGTEGLFDDVQSASLRPADGLVVLPHALGHTDVQGAARVRIDAVVLIAHVIERRPMPLQEQQSVEVQQRIRKGDPATQFADLLEQLVAGLALGRIDRLAGLLKSVQLGGQRRQFGRVLHGLQIGQQRRCTAQDHVGRVAVRRLDERLGMVGLVGHTRKMLAPPQITLQRRILPLAFGLGRSVRVVPERHDRRPSPELDAVDQQPQTGHRDPRLPSDFGQRPQSHIAARHFLGKSHDILAVAMLECAGGHTLARLILGVRDVQLVLGDRAIAAFGTRQVSEPADLVTRPQVDSQLVRRRWILETELGVPHGIRVAIHSPVPLVTRFLAVRANGHHHRLHLGGGAHREDEGGPPGDHAHCQSRFHCSFSWRFCTFVDLSNPEDFRRTTPVTAASMVSSAANGVKSASD